LKSGSKRSAARPPELAPWQHRALRIVAASPIAQEVVFGGGAALAACHLHHRTSQDLDFFLSRELEPGELVPLARSLETSSMKAEIEVVGPRTSLMLIRRSRYVGRIDFAYYPFDPVGNRTRWRGLAMESLEDMTVNKLQAVLTRNQPRDFVDLYFLLREGPIRDLNALLGLVRAKFDVGHHPLGLAARLLLVREIRELPRMLRRVTLAELVAFFEERARELIRVVQQ
jgi:predicted nucleotidyltransferase component of viral defense system